MYQSTIATRFICHRLIRNSVGRPTKAMVVKRGHVRETITHLMGLIVLAMGFQFALTGIKAFMA
jgi:hypothetical protein